MAWITIEIWNEIKIIIEIESGTVIAIVFVEIIVIAFVIIVTFLGV